MLGLLDARVIAGDASLAEQLQGAVLGDWRAMADKRLPDLHQLVLDRRQRFGEASQLLEPDLKESYGGLRDATVLAGGRGLVGHRRAAPGLAGLGRRSCSTCATPCTG